jgi:adenylosuccinate synthase
VARLGIRVGDLLDKELFLKRLKSVLEIKNAILTRVYQASPLSLEEIYEQYCDYGERLAPFVQETSSLIRQAVARGEPVLLEGAQGTLLDPDFGTYPYVTSSSPLAGAGCIGTGLGPREIQHVVGVFKAYNTRVGAGPMPTELKDETGELIRQKAQEYGATTGRPRRCGWFDAVAARFSVEVNSISHIALTHLDIYDSFPSIKICAAYKVDGRILTSFPSDISVLEKCEPVYEEIEGWQQPTSGIRDFAQLPQAARNYISRLEMFLSCPISLLSVGPERDQMITVRPFSF